MCNKEDIAQNVFLLLKYILVLNYEEHIKCLTKENLPINSIGMQKFTYSAWLQIQNKPFFANKKARRYFIRYNLYMGILFGSLYHRSSSSNGE